MRSQRITGPVAVRPVLSAKSSSFVIIIAYYRVDSESVIPDRLILTVGQTEIIDVRSRMPDFGQPVAKSGRQLLIDQEIH